MFDLSLLRNNVDRLNQSMVTSWISFKVLFGNGIESTINLLYIRISGGSSKLFGKYDIVPFKVKQKSMKFLAG